MLPVEKIQDCRLVHRMSDDVLIVLVSAIEKRKDPPAHHLAIERLLTLRG